MVRNLSSTACIISRLEGNGSLQLMIRNMPHLLYDVAPYMALRNITQLTSRHTIQFANILLVTSDTSKVGSENPYHDQDPDLAVAIM
jgi:hypothetical protein